MAAQLWCLCILIVTSNVLIGPSKVDFDLCIFKPFQSTLSHLCGYQSLETFADTLSFKRLRLLIFGDLCRIPFLSDVAFALPDLQLQNSDEGMFKNKKNQQKSISICFKFCSQYTSEIQTNGKRKICNIVQVRFYIFWRFRQIEKKKSVILFKFSSASFGKDE